MLVPQNLLKFSSISEKNIWEVLQKKMNDQLLNYNDCK